MGDDVALSRVERLVGRDAFEECDPDERLVRRVLAAAWIGVSVLTPLWGLVYIAFGEVTAGLVPIVYSAITVVSFAARRRYGGWEWLRISQLVQHLFLPFILMWLVGGFAPSGAVLVWAFLAPLNSLWASREREAIYVVVGLVALTVVSAIVEPYLRPSSNIPEWATTVFFAGNFIAMTGVIYTILVFFVRKQATAIRTLRRNRELESAYLQQSISLRQSEKLATIGRLSAGLAHELNNPAAAIEQVTKDLTRILIGQDLIKEALGRLNLTEDETEAVWAFATRVGDQAGRPTFIGPLERSDREAEIEDALDAAGVANAWEIAPALVGLGIAPSDIDGLRQRLVPANIPTVTKFLAIQFERQNLLGSLDESTTRIVSMVKALKSYTRLDQAPRQYIDVREGLESTLVMLQSRITQGIEVRRDYSTDVPSIEAHGGELNQVWTNIIDNALDAMDGRGVISIRTFVERPWVVVEIEDDGPGIPPNLLDSVFEPFVTSKPPGAGTGLGLNISHGIVTQNHDGLIDVTSEPGSTRFRVRLPINPRASGEGDSSVPQEQKGA